MGTRRDHFTVYTNLESLCCTSESNVACFTLQNRILKEYYEQFHAKSTTNKMGKILEIPNVIKQ